MQSSKVTAILSVFLFVAVAWVGYFNSTADASSVPVKKTTTTQAPFKGLYPSPYPLGFSPLHKAIFLNNPLKLKQLLLSNAKDINTKTIQGDTPLQLFVSDREVVAIGLYYSLPEEKMNQSEKAFFRALDIITAEAEEQFEKELANPSATMEEKKMLQAIRLQLLDLKPYMPKEASEPSPPIKGVEIVSLFLRHGATVNEKVANSASVLDSAILGYGGEDRMDVLKLLIKSGAKLNLKNSPNSKDYFVMGSFRSDSEKATVIKLLKAAGAKK
jgi:hypothetical protein